MTDFIALADRRRWLSWMAKNLAGTREVPATDVPRIAQQWQNLYAKGENLSYEINTGDISQLIRTIAVALKTTRGDRLYTLVGTFGSGTVVSIPISETEQLLRHVAEEDESIGFCPLTLDGELIVDLPPRILQGERGSGEAMVSGRGSMGEIVHAVAVAYPGGTEFRESRDSPV